MMTAPLTMPNRKPSARSSALWLDRSTRPAIRPAMTDSSTSAARNPPAPAAIRASTGGSRYCDSSAARARESQPGDDRRADPACERKHLAHETAQIGDDGRGHDDGEKREVQRVDVSHARARRPDLAPAPSLAATSATWPTVSMRSPPLPAGCRAEGTIAVLETELLRFAQPRVAMRDRADLAGKPDFAEPHAPRRRGRALQRRDERGGHGEVGRRLGNAQPARDIEIDVAPAERDPGARLQHGQHHGEPSGVPADGRPGAASRRRAGRPAPGFRPAAGARPPRPLTPPCRRARRRPAGPRGKARRGWRPRQALGPSSRTRRSRQSPRSGSSRRAECGNGGRVRPRNRARCRPCAPARAGPLWRRPW